LIIKLWWLVVNCLTSHQPSLVRASIFKSFAYVSGAQVNDYVIVHAGFALSILDRDQAEQTLNYLRQLNTR
jgi:hydrogenase maturation factor